LLGVNGGRPVRLTTLPPPVSRLSRENVGAFFHRHFCFAFFTQKNNYFNITYYRHIELKIYLFSREIQLCFGDEKHNIQNIFKFFMNYTSARHFSFISGISLT
jgi:hypothetical protein